MGLLLLTVAAAVPPLAAAEVGTAVNIGSFQLQAPAGWQPKQPSSSIIAYEFAVPAAKDDLRDGRATVMAAGGSIDANIERWYAQFTQPDGKSSKDRAKVKRITVKGQTVHLVDISGTFNESRGPVAGRGTPRPDYRMLAAIIETKEANFFVKFYGPRRTVDGQEEAFVKMIEGLDER